MDGGVLLDVDPAIPIFFNRYTVQFEGTGAPAELRFSGSGFLDDVSVQQISTPAQQSDSGIIAFSDAPTDTHSAGFVAQGGGPGYVGTFSLDAVDQSGNSVGWDFVVDNFALQSLRANQTVTQTYIVTISDQLGGSTVQNVTVQLHGVNDAGDDHHQ